MSLSTTNTICVYFEDCEEKITPLEYANFIKNELKYSNQDIIAMGVTVKNRLRIKLSNEDLVEDVFDKIKKLGTYTINERKYELSIENESTKHTVKIHGVPFEMPDVELKRAFSYYGIVENIKKEKWKGIGLDIYNEIISIKMEIKIEIPSYIRLYGRLYWVTYFGQTRTCRRCNSTQHEAKNCTFRASDIIKQRVNYADITRGDKNVFTPPFFNNETGSSKRRTQVLEKVGTASEEIKIVREKETESDIKRRNNKGINEKDDETDKIKEGTSIVREVQDNRKGSKQGESTTEFCSQHNEVHPNQLENKKCKLKRTKSTEGSSDEITKPLSKKLNAANSWADEMEDEITDTSSPDFRTSEFDFSLISQYATSKSEEEMKDK